MEELNLGDMFVGLGAGLASSVHLALLLALYLGDLIEAGPTERLFSDPKDERTRNYVRGAFG